MVIKKHNDGLCVLTFSVNISYQNKIYSGGNCEFPGPFRDFANFLKHSINK